MIKKNTLLFYFLALKIILDIFSPSKELNMLALLCISTVLIIVNFNYTLIQKLKINYIITYFLLYVVISEFSLQSIKFLISIVFFVSVVLSCSKIRYDELAKLLFKVSKLYLACFYLSIFLSILTGIYTQRKVYNFEHVNLFGSYIVFSSTLFLVSLYLMNKTKTRISSSNIVIYKLLFIIIAFLSTSTGAFLAQCIILLPIQYFSLKNSLKLLISLTGFVLLTYYSTQIYLPDLHQKIFGTLTVFDNYTFKEFYDASVSQDNESLKDAMEAGGSFTWRLNTYIFYYSIFTNLDIFQMLFGQGASSFAKYAYFLPHNDFITITLDFGLLGLFGLLLILYSKYKNSFTINFYPFNYFAIFLLLRFGFENCIYSFYLFSLILVILGVLLSISTRIKLNRL